MPENSKVAPDVTFSIEKAEEKTRIKVENIRIYSKQYVTTSLIERELGRSIYKEDKVKEEANEMYTSNFSKAQSHTILKDSSRP